MNKNTYNSQDCVLELELLKTMVLENRNSGLIVGNCHGCFDVLHVGHLRHFEAASKICDILIVTVTSDQYINKGPNRPVFPAEQRAELISGIGVVDYVSISNFPSAIEMLDLIKPSLFIKGQEYETNAQKVNPNFLEEKKAIERNGGHVAYTYEWTSSSSSVIKRIRS